MTLIMPSGPGRPRAAAMDSGAAGGASGGGGGGGGKVLVDSSMLGRLYSVQDISVIIVP